MRFTPVVSLLALAASASAVTSVSESTSGIGALTELISETNNIADGVSTANIFTMGPV